MDDKSNKHFKSDIEYAKYMAVISSLTRGYDGILFISHDMHETEIIRENREITRYLPGWDGNSCFCEKMKLIETCICHPDDRELFHVQTQKNHVTEVLQKASEFNLRFRIVIEGKVSYYLLIINPVSWSGTGTDGYVAGWTCIDDIVRQEQERIQAIEDARVSREANQFKSLMVQNISHDIRTPLNSIVGFSQILSMPNLYLDDEDRAQFAEYITSSAEMLTVFIEDMLNLSDIEHKNLKMNISSVSCFELIRKSVNCCRTRVANGVNLHYTSEMEPAYSINTDGKRVQQIIVNLISNACKHTDTGEILVHCSAAENPGYVTFSVTDTGCGVPEDKAEEIFERFKSLDHDKGGHGIGLNISRTLAELLDGKVSLDTSYKGGARFVLLLPDNAQA